MTVLWLYLCFVVRDFQDILIDQMLVNYFSLFSVMSPPSNNLEFFFLTFSGHVFRVSIDGNYHILSVVVL